MLLPSTCFIMHRRSVRDCQSFAFETSVDESSTSRCCINGDRNWRIKRTWPETITYRRPIYHATLDNMTDLIQRKRDKSVDLLIHDGRFTNLLFISSYSLFVSFDFMCPVLCVCVCIFISTFILIAAFDCEINYIYITTSTLRFTFLLLLSVPSINSAKVVMY